MRPVPTPAQLDASPYLARLAERHAPGDPEALIARAGEADDLVALKAEFFLSWSARSLAGEDFARLSDWQTRFAEATLDRALELAWRERARALRLDAPLEGLCVLGLGKLGGRDLNLSSDVDLVAIYDRARFPVPEHRGQAYEADRLLRAMGRILQPRHSPDFVWRVDWRLRPEASTRGLAMEAEAALDFYFFRALGWHRLAMMKARPVAGDRAVGEAFLAALEPFVWRRNLDLRAVDELAAIKARINDEHPGLRGERAAPSPVTDDPSGFNVKLGTGGIREIEFLANSAQLLWGGKRAELRVAHTPTALARLAEHGHMEAEAARDLAAIYERHRRLETAIQMRANEHTHIVPDGEALGDVLTLLGGPDQEAFARELRADRERVAELFARAFAEATDAPAPDAPTETERDDVPELAEPKWAARLDGAARDTVADWRSGFTRHGLAPGWAGADDFTAELLWRIGASGAEPTEAIARADRFFADLSRSGQYLHLLARHPELLDPLLTPLLHSPHMGELLRQSPHIIDVFLSPESGLDTGFVFARADFEGRLEGLRRFVNEHLYLSYYELMAGVTDPAGLQARLTALAEAALEAALRIVREDLGADAVPICVVGLGKLGTRKLMPLSDLDLLFLFPDDTDPERRARMVRRLKTTLSAPMSEGIAYELDMRLRPNGRSGPAAVTLSSFAGHHAERARNWEHVALLGARVVAGDAETGARAEALVADILARPRDADQLRDDLARMWGRIADQRLRDTPARLFDARLRLGGLMQVEFTRDSRRLMGLSGKKARAALEAAEGYFSDQLVWERLLGLTGRADVPERFAGDVPSGRTGVLATAVERVTAKTFRGAETGGEDQAVRWMG